MSGPSLTVAVLTDAVSIRVYLNRTASFAQNDSGFAVVPVFLGRDSGEFSKVLAKIVDGALLAEVSHSRSPW